MAPEEAAQLPETGLADSEELGALSTARADLEALSTARADLPPGKCGTTAVPKKRRQVEENSLVETLRDGTRARKKRRLTETEHEIRQRLWDHLDAPPKMKVMRERGETYSASSRPAKLLSGKTSALFSNIRDQMA